MNTGNKAVVILGGSKTVFEEYEEAKKFHSFDTVIGINNIIEEVKEVNHVVSMHPGKVPRWLKKRRENNLPDPESYWTARDRSVQVPSTLKFEFLANTRGGSGLLAIYVARHLGFKKIVLAGIPMTMQGEHYHTSGNWKECRLYRIVWEANVSLKTDVRSFSGWTAATFGVPTKDWLEEES